MQAIEYLQSIHPVLPWAILTALIWAVQWAIRKWAPGIWERAANVPFGDDKPLVPVVRVARKVWQGLPSVLVGALIGALAIGQDPRGAWLGALAGAVAPVWHELLKAFPGPYRGGSPPAAALLLLVISLPTQGCAGSFEEARLVAPEQPVAAARDSGRCVSLDNQHRVWGALGKGAAVVSGSSGLATIPAETRELEVGLAIGSVSAAAFAATAIYVSDSASESYVRECTE